MYVFIQYASHEFAGFAVLQPKRNLDVSESTRNAFATRKGQHSTAGIGDDRLLLGRSAYVDVGVVVTQCGVTVKRNHVLVESGFWEYGSQHEKSENNYHVFGVY